MNFSLIITCQDDTFMDENVPAIIAFYTREFPECEVLAISKDMEFENAINIHTDSEYAGEKLILGYKAAKHDRVILNNGRIVVSQDAIKDSFEYDMCALHHPELVSLMEFANEDFLEASSYTEIHENSWPFLETLKSEIPVQSLSFSKKVFKECPLVAQIENYKSLLFYVVHQFVSMKKEMVALPYRGYYLFDYELNKFNINDCIVISQIIHGDFYEGRWDGRYVMLPLPRLEKSKIVNEKNKVWSVTRGTLRVKGVPKDFGYDFAKAKITFEARSNFNKFRISTNNNQYMTIPRHHEGWNQYEIPIKKMKNKNNSSLSFINFKCMDKFEIRNLAVVLPAD